MTDQKYLRPAAGITLPLADGRPWPQEGAFVDVDQYVRRRLADGDVVEATPPAAADPADEAPSTRKGK